MTAAAPLDVGSGRVGPCGPFGEYTASRDNVFMTRFLG
jgi:hypothetical protein